MDRCKRIVACVLAAAAISSLIPGAANAAGAGGGVEPVRPTHAGAQAAFDAVADERGDRIEADYPANETVALIPQAAQPTRFADVPAGAWYVQSVEYADAAGLITGYGNGLFGVGKALTRAQLATILWRYTFNDSGVTYDSGAANSTGMADVKNGAWYTCAANWAVAAGVINGVDARRGRRFQPDAPLDRQTMVAILANYAGVTSQQNTAALSSMPDAAAVDAWARNGVAWALNQGVITGAEDNGVRYVKPHAKVTREVAAATMMNALTSGVLASGRNQKLSLQADYERAAAHAVRQDGAYAAGDYDDAFRVDRLNAKAHAWLTLREDGVAIMAQDNGSRTYFTWRQTGTTSVVMTREDKSYSAQFGPGDVLQYIKIPALGLAFFRPGGE